MVRLAVLDEIRDSGKRGAAVPAHLQHRRLPERACAGLRCLRRSAKLVLCGPSSAGGGCGGDGCRGSGALQPADEWVTQCSQS